MFKNMRKDKNDEIASLITRASVTIAAIFDKIAEDMLLDAMDEMQGNRNALPIINKPIIVSQLAMEVSIRLLEYGMSESTIFANEAFAPIMDGLKTDKQRRAEVKRIQTSIIECHITAAMRRIAENMDRLIAYGDKCAEAHERDDMMEMLVKQHEAYNDAIKLCPITAE